MNIFAKWTVSSCKSGVYSTLKVSIDFHYGRGPVLKKASFIFFFRRRLHFSMTAGYGIGTPRDSPYRDLVTSAILKVGKYKQTSLQTEMTDGISCFYCFMNPIAFFIL